MTSDTFVDRRARALASDPRLNIALEASAGTGKTSVLVARYVQLMEEGASPRHVLAITFTRKAAGEMKTRIAAELQSRPALWKELRDRLFEIHVTTIDAFCLGLLREFPLEAGLDPDLSLLDQVEVERLVRESIDDVMLRSRNERLPDLAHLVTRFGEVALRHGLHDFLSSRLVKADVLHQYVTRFLPKSPSLSESLSRLSEALLAALGGKDGVERFLGTGPPDPPPPYRAFAFALARACDPERVTPADVEEVASFFLTAELEPRRRPPFRASIFERRVDYERHRDRLLGIAPLVAGSYRQWNREKDAYAVRHLEELYRRGGERFEALKNRRAGLDFTDVLEKAVALLQNRGEFSQSRFRLESRYHHLLIDEFQDTNEAQWKLVAALVSSWGEGQGLVQEAILEEQAQGRGTGNLREPSLFIVGDRKQSIYGWRDARVEVLETASRHLLRLRPDGGRRLTLRHSFRARGELLFFLNDLFAEMPKVPKSLEWSFQYRDTDHFPVGEVDPEASPVAVAMGAELARVAGAVADEIARLLEEEHLRPRDIAILFRNRSSYRVYEEALVARGVPAYVYRGLGFFDAPEVRDVKALVRFLAEPDKELRAAELARSRFVGVSDTALSRLAVKRRSAGASPLSRWLTLGEVETGIPLEAADRSLYERAAKLVPSWLSLVDRIPPVDLIDRVLGESDYARVFAGHDQSWENLKKILEMVRRAENRGYLTMARLADFLESATTDEESPAVLEAIDAVNLMTIHAAKGLEFESVFLVNLHQRTRRDQALPRIREQADGRIEVSALATLDPDQGPSRVVEEEKRLLYVALTRARRSLVLAGVVTGSTEGERSLFSLLPESFQAAAREAAAATSSDETVRWKGHRLRVLPSGDARHYEPERPTRALEAHIVPLSTHPLESSLAPALEDDAPAPSDRELAEGEYLNVPFTLYEDGALYRGSIRRLVVSTDRVRFTGDPRCRPVLEALFPERTIVG